MRGEHGWEEGTSRGVPECWRPFFFGLVHSLESGGLNGLVMFGGHGGRSGIQWHRPDVVWKWGTLRDISRYQDARENGAGETRWQERAFLASLYACHLLVANQVEALSNSVLLTHPPYLYFVGNCQVRDVRDVRGRGGVRVSGEDRSRAGCGRICLILHVSMLFAPCTGELVRRKSDLVRTLTERPLRAYEYFSLYL